ncbi:MAG: type II toxin-antitoxin system VapC family toxin [Ardenticatenaceae bacterium]|nr:type II toxin-antitoxin system VapC family toxin [Ardenticatenaceae bacterium]
MTRSLVCVDASLIVRTLVPGPLSGEAEAVLRKWQHEKKTLIAPALFAFEVTATLRRMVYLKALTPSRGEEVLTQFLRIPIRLSHRRTIFPLAWKLAKAFNRPRTYDTSYLALAQLKGCEFWTADEKLYNAVKHRLPWVKWLGVNSA